MTYITPKGAIVWKGSYDPNMPNIHKKNNDRQQRHWMLLIPKNQCILIGISAWKHAGAKSAPHPHIPSLLFVVCCNQQPTKIRLLGGVRHDPEPRRRAVWEGACRPHALDGDGGGRDGDHSRHVFAVLRRLPRGYDTYGRNR